MTSTTTPIPIGVNDGSHLPGLNTAADAVAWIDEALRGVERGRGDDAMVSATFRELSELAVASWASLIERARVAERQAVVEELAGDGDAVNVLIEQARADERSIVEQESAVLLVKVEEQRRAERAQRIAANRAAWATLAASLGIAEG